MVQLILVVVETFWFVSNSLATKLADALLGLATIFHSSGVNTTSTGYMAAVSRFVWIEYRFALANATTVLVCFVTLILREKVTKTTEKILHRITFCFLGLAFLPLEIDCQARNDVFLNFWRNCRPTG